jgi:hypothetical protein
MGTAKNGSHSVAELTLWVPPRNTRDLFRAGCRTLYAGANAMEARLTSDQRRFVSHAVESGPLSSAEDTMSETLALCEDRERRRMEFRSSLLEAQASLARLEARKTTQESARRISAEFSERRPARMMAELANAH